MNIATALQKREMGFTPAFLRDVKRHQGEREREREKHKKDIYKDIIQKNVNIQKNAGALARQALNMPTRMYLHDRIRELEGEKQELMVRYKEAMVEARDDPMRVAQELNLEGREGASFTQDMS